MHGSTLVAAGPRVDRVIGFGTLRMRRAETASYVQRLRDVCRGPDVMGGSYVYSVCEMCRRPDVMGSSDGQDVWTCVWMHRRGLREGSAVDVDVWSLDGV